MTLVYFYLEIYLIKKSDAIQKVRPYFLLFSLYLLTVVSRHFKLMDEKIGNYILTYMLNLQPFVGVLIYNAITTNKKWWIMVLLFSFSLRNAILCTVISIFIILLFIPQDKVCNLVVKTLNCKIILYIGSVSYMWYLIHQNIGYVVMEVCNKVFCDYISIGIAILTTFIASVTLLKAINIVKNILSNKIGWERIKRS